MCHKYRQKRYKKMIFQHKKIPGISPEDFFKTIEL